MHDQREQAVRELRRIADKLESGAGGFVEYSTNFNMAYHEPGTLILEVEVMGIVPEDLR